ncbi:MAG: ADP-ribosyl-(dinitrogen reductase) hydrolase [Chthonomonadaceae bacterium]|nr:ADP-ribosyl-(dinitrogen reductase) hydrolase [Chthonomonadaceae bacterium]
MVGMTFDGPPEIEPGDEIEVVTAIRRHDIVCWERVSASKWIMRALSPEEAIRYSGRKFQVDKGDEPGTLKYTEVTSQSENGIEKPAKERNTGVGSESLESRIVGAMLGLACGDALGAPAEFHDKAYIRRQWGTLTEMVGGGVWAPGEWTDDTGMALCIAEGILAHPDDPIEATGKHFLEWRKTAKDVGSTIGAALSAFRGDWPTAAQSTSQAKQGKAAGNGSLMRTLPVALAYGPARMPMLRIAARLSAMTHWDGEAETCCLLYCLWIRNILEGLTLHEAWHRALSEGQEVVREGGRIPDAPGGQSTFKSQFWGRLEGVEALTYEQLQPSGYAGYSVECLEAAVWCCLHSDTLEETLVQAVNLAGEADTIGAVAGGVAGAYWGVEAIPERWLEKLYRRADLEQTAQRLINLRRHRQVYATPKLPALDFNRVTDRILAGRNPLTGRDIELLSGMGITHVLDLREPKEWSSPNFGTEALAEIERLGLQRRNVPIRDTKEPIGEDLDSACRFLEETLTNENYRVYVHCRAGMERTAAILIAYYARHNSVLYEEALARLREGRPILMPLPDQERAVREWMNHQPTSEGESEATRENVTLLWDGVTQSMLLSEQVQDLRQRLSDAAKSYDWKETLEILSEAPELVNTTRPDSKFLYAPLHQAAHGGAPIEVVERLLELGAWRTLQNAKGERPIDVAVRQKKTHLYLILEPQYKRHMPADVLSKVQIHFHEVIRGRIRVLDYSDGLRLPEIEPLLEVDEAKVWFAVPGMYGGFLYWIEGEGVDVKLIAESWCRVAGGSGQRHEVTSFGSRLTAEGFV